MYVLPILPYSYDALEPVLSGHALRLHYQKHHGAYVKSLNTLLAETEAALPALEGVIAVASQSSDRRLFNNAAQTWNHSFFWQSMSALPLTPNSDFVAAIKAAFGDLATLREGFVSEGVAHFGAGWLWLAADRGGALRVLSTHDAEDMLPLSDLTPLLTCDLWEHAYYLDHQNDRKRYLETWFDALPNWEFAAAQWLAAQGSGQVWRHPPPSAV